MRCFLQWLVPALIMAGGCSGDHDKASSREGQDGTLSGNDEGRDRDDGGTDLTPGDGSGGTEGGEGNGRASGGQSGPTCQSLARQADKITPNIMIVLDRSSSMETEVAGETRWSGSVKAVRTVARELDDVIRFGLLTFPSGNRDSTYTYSLGSKPDIEGPLCGVDRVDVSVAESAASSIADALESRMPGGLTPTARALELARDALQAGSSKDIRDFVLLVTDGAPNCGKAYVAGLEACENEIAGGSDKCVKGLSQEPESDIEDTLDTIAGLAKERIKTYVVGFQTRGVVNLDRMAQAGDTGDTVHRSVETGAELLDALREITGIAASCTFKLDAPISDPIYVRVEIDGQQRRYKKDWVLEGDQQTITVLGDACDALQAGAGLIEVTVECEPVVVL